MFGGGGPGGFDSRQMEQMMKQMGIDIEDIEAEEVIIRTPDEELVFDNPEVQCMDAQGNETYTIIGSPEVREPGTGADAADDDAGVVDDGNEADEGIPQGDVDIVAQRTGVSEDDAREALEATDGDLAAAVERLE